MPTYEVVIRLRDVHVEIEAADESLAVDKAIVDFEHDPTPEIVGGSVMRMEAD